jgi:hypothetical protein
MIVGAEKLLNAAVEAIDNLAFASTLPTQAEAWVKLRIVRERIGEVLNDGEPDEAL